MKTYKVIILTSIFISSALFFSSSIASRYVDDAEKYYRKGEYNAAIIQLKNRLKEKPNDSFARLKLAKSYMKINEYVQADKEIRRAYQLNSTNEEIVITYSEMLLLQRKYKKADEILDKSFSVPEKENQRQIYKAYAKLGLNQIADAKQVFLKFANDLENVAVFNGLAKIAILEKELDVAHQWVEKSLKIEPNNTETLLIKAKIEIINQNNAAALDIYNKLIEKNEKKLSLYLKRADIKIRLKDFNGAEKDIHRVLSKVKNHPMANYMLAQIELQKQNYKEAQEASQIVLNVMPRHMESMLNIGLSNFGLGNYNQAEKYLTQYVFEKPNNISAQNILANVYLIQNKGEAALLILESIDEEKIKNNAEILKTMGSAYLLTGEFQKGIDVLNKAQKLEPHSDDIQKRLILGYLKKGDTNNVIDNLEVKYAYGNTTPKENYLLIVSYLQKKELQKTNAMLKTLIKKTPDDATLYNLKAILERLKGNNKKAKGYYNKALQIDIKHIPSYIGLAELAYGEKDFTTAESLYAKVTQINPKYFKAYIYLAMVADRQNKQQEIEKQLKIGMEQAKGDVKSEVFVASFLSKFYIKQNTPEKIMQIAQGLNRSYPNDNTALSFLAITQMLNKKNEQAEQTLKRIIDNNNSDFKHRLLLVALLTKKKGNESEVLEILNSMISIDPDNPKPVLLKFTYLLNLKSYKQAMEVANYAEKQFPSLALGYRSKGDVFFLENKLDKALEYYQAAYKIKPDNELLFIISGVLNKQGNKTEAIKWLASELENNDEDLEIHYNIAMIYENNKQYDKAIEHYLKMLEIETEHLIALNNLAWLYIQEKNPAAVKYARKAYEKTPKTVAVIDTYGYAQIKLGDRLEGIELLKKAKKLSPETHDIQYHLAEGYYLNGETKKAKVLLNSLVNKKIEFSEKENAISLYSRLK